MIEIAENAGFCPGVNRAVKNVLELAEEKKGKIYTLGELIHNNSVLEELREKGIYALDVDELLKKGRLATAEEPVIAVIRTHGIPDETETLLLDLCEENPYFTIRDMTCPYVKKIHGIAEDNRENFLIVFGDPSHPEVEGIVSRADSYVTVLSPEELDGLNTMGKTPVLVAQTTQNRKIWKKIKEKFKNLFTNGLIFDTICGVTEKRQEVAAALSEECDCMIVIGSRQSSNSRKLFDTVSEKCKNCFFVENGAELPLNMSKFRKIGITAGASTPGRLIEEVYKLMSEIIKEENFAEMLDSAFKTLHTGETVTGIVSAITGNELQVDLGTKVTGIITAEEATDESGAKLSDLFAIGDEIEAVVIKVNDRDGYADLSKRRADAKLRWMKVLDAYNDGEILEGKIVEAVKGGVVIVADGNRVFVPASQTGVAKDGDLTELVGQTRRFKLIEADEGKKKAVGSIRRVENAERKAKIADFWANIQVGDTFEGTVRSLTSYGAFVDLGGVDGMVHASELSWTHIKSPADVVSVGDKINVFVKKIDVERKRISLGYKTEETNPWNIFKANYAVNDIIKAKIVSIMPFGAFAEICTGVDGLIHISQLADRKVGKPEDVVAVGDEIEVEIVGIDDEKKQVALSRRSVLEAANAAEEEPAEAEETEEEAPTEETETPAVYEF